MLSTFYILGLQHFSLRHQYRKSTNRNVQQIYQQKLVTMPILWGYIREYYENLKDVLDNFLNIDKQTGSKTIKANATKESINRCKNVVKTAKVLQGS